MKYRDFEVLFRKYPIFNLATIELLTGEKRSSLLNALARWKKTGRILTLKRGYYTLPNAVSPPIPALIANEIYRPSYLSLEWSLSYYGLIPDAVFACTSVTTRQGNRFSNAFGDYYYQHIKPSAYWGYRQQQSGPFKVRIVEPEKALLDYWHLHSGEWTKERLEALRLQQLDTINLAKLQQYSHRWNSPRLKKAVRTALENSHLFISA